MADVTALTHAERLQILQVAIRKMKKEGAVDSDLDLDAIASQTENYDRDELELLVKLAQGNALSAQLLRNNGIPTTEGLKLKMEDFTSSMDNVKNESSDP